MTNSRLKELINAAGVNNFQSDNSDVLCARPAWASYWISFLAIAGILLITLSIGLDFTLAGAIVVLIFARILFYRHTHLYEILDERRLRVTHSFIARQRREFLISDKIQSDIVQDIIPRLLSYGTLSFWTGDQQSRMDWTNVKFPTQIETLVKTLATLQKNETLNQNMVSQPEKVLRPLRAASVNDFVDTEEVMVALRTPRADIINNLFPNKDKRNRETHEFKIKTWLKQVGDYVEKNEPIAIIDGSIIADDYRFRDFIPDDPTMNAPESGQLVFIGNTNPPMNIYGVIRSTTSLIECNREHAFHSGLMAYTENAFSHLKKSWKCRRSEEDLTSATKLWPNLLDHYIERQHSLSLGFLLLENTQKNGNKGYQMKHIFTYTTFLSLFFLAVTASSMVVTAAEDTPSVDYLSFAQGAIPVKIEGAAGALRVGMEHALQVIDGDDGGFSLTPKPGDASTKIVFVYWLPALTTFDVFAIPNVLETPSPSQTFVSTIEIAGSDQGPEGPFHVLAKTSLQTHAEKDQVTAFSATLEMPVRWVRVSLGGGIDIQRDKTFFEFSEIVGHGRQEPVPLLNDFTGKWKGRGTLLELKQDEMHVSGCYDRVGDLVGTVDGNLLRATGKTRTGDIGSTFLLTVNDDGEIIGVRSTNGAPFRLYAGAAAPNLTTECSEQPAAPFLGCDSIIHGIHFGFDSATIRPESQELLNALFKGLKATTSGITVIGHTSSEGTDTYNEQLSQRRAEAVVAALVVRGINAGMISAQGRGEKQPIANNTTGAGRSLNRRVEIACQ